MTSPFTLAIIDLIRRIPEGRLCTYGLIAAHAGSPRAARQVARILHSSSEKHDLPWHRVVNREGRIVLKPGAGYEIQKALLVLEGVEVDADGGIDLDRFLWQPQDESR